MKKFSVLIVAALTLFLYSCSKKEAESEYKDCVIQWGTTWYEDGMFYEVDNNKGDSVLCYYSKTNDRSAVMCGMPECTHNRKTFPDCGALMGNEMFNRNGFNRVGEKLYYLAEISPTEDALGSLDLIESDVDGKNRRSIASIENATPAFITNVQYIDGHVLISYYLISECVKDKNTGELEFVKLEKYRFFVKRIDISNGEIETLVTREEYNGVGTGTVYQNKLYYNYSYTLEPSTGELETPETVKKRYGGFFIRDLATGEEKEYKDISVRDESLEYFSPDRIMGYDKENKKLCRFDPETETFNNIADYSNGGYTADDKDALFVQGPDSETWTVYNFESGKLTQISANTGDLHFSPNQAYTVGDTVWVDISSGNGSLRHAYIDRNDFFSGKFENIKFIKDVNLQ